jgi:hypothetical protein
MKFASEILKEMGYGFEGSRGPSESTVTPGKNIRAAAAPPTKMAVARDLSDLFLRRAARALVDGSPLDSGIAYLAPFVPALSAALPITMMAGEWEQRRRQGGLDSDRRNPRWRTASVTRPNYGCFHVQDAGTSEFRPSGDGAGPSRSRD